MSSLTSSIPSTKLQKKSEDNKANIGYVYQRWNEIEAHLRSYSARDTQFATDVKQYLDIKPSPNVKLTGIDKKNWTRRRNKQVTAVHLLAFYLHPKNYKESLSPEQEKTIVAHFKKYTSDYKAAYEQFLDFRKQEGSFGLDGIAWEYSDKPSLFWRSMEISCPDLAPFARRVLITIANSVPSERAFSTMNYIHNKLRNSLTVERANKLSFIQMNSGHITKAAKEQELEQKLHEFEEEYGWLYGQN